MVSPQESRSSFPAMHSTNTWLIIILIALVGVLLFQQLFRAGSGDPYTPRQITPRGDLAESETTTIDIFRQTSGSVVFIRTKGVQFTFVGEQTEQELASGTGFVWDRQGHLVTNLHVVRDALETDRTILEAQLADGTVYDAELAGAVYQHDIAILRLVDPPDNLRPITLGESADLLVGQSVLAIGNPFGFDQTLSTGVIGGLNRTVATNQQNEFLSGLIQTDAAINPGNSGGPLLDSAGRLIGVNTAIVSPTGSYSGLGFAVPVDTVMQAVNMVLDQDRPRPPELGITILKHDLMRQLGLPEAIINSGPVIQRVLPNTAAARAGLRPSVIYGRRLSLGDQLAAVNGEPLGPEEDALRKRLEDFAAGESVELTVLRTQRDRFSGAIQRIQSEITVELQPHRALYE